jgi:streptomycin 6-kinase
MNGNLSRLKQTIINARGSEGERWFNDLPQTIEKLKKHWALTCIKPVTNMSWHYVAFAEKNEQPVVLKFGADEKTIYDEYQALKHFNGLGMIEVLDYYQPLKALLLARAVPGAMLKEEDRYVIEAYAEVVKKLSSNHPIQHQFLHVRDWCQVIDEMNDPRIPTEYILKAKGVRQWLLDSMRHEYLCHGDLHLENILKHQDEWVAIDPKGIIGEMAFEAAACDLIFENLATGIHQLAKALDIDEQRLIAWIFLRIMLSVQWFIEDNGNPYRMLKMADNIFPLL